MKPDFNILRDAFLNKPTSRIPLYEHIIDVEIMEEVMGKKFYGDTLSAQDNMVYFHKNSIDFWHQMGYDSYSFEVVPAFAERHEIVADDTAGTDRQTRGWVDENSGPIQEWADLENEKYWPSGEASGDFAQFETIEKLLPEGMKLVGGFSGGPFEHATFLMGLEPFSLRIYEEPDFAQKLTDLIGERISYGAERISKMDCLGIYRFGDDLGYKTSTMISPNNLRSYVFPWYKKIVDIVHKNDKPFLLHSCGNLADVMEDIITCGVDTKHSFEDTIITVEEARERWGDRITFIGGIDVDFLCRASVDEIKERTKRTMDNCSKKGGYVIGSGNSIANYVPVKSYLAMVTAAHEFNGQ